MPSNTLSEPLSEINNVLRKSVFPNFYSQKMNFHPLYRDISRNMEVRSNEFKDLL
jgi:hypothetical protein